MHQGCFYAFLQVTSALTFRKKLSELLGGRKLLFWAVGENHLNHIRGDDCTLRFRHDRKEERKQNPGLAVNWYQVSLFLSKNLDKPITVSK